MHLVRTRHHLAPGLRVVRRGLHHLQVGLYDGRRALLPRTPDVERTISLLLERQAVAEDPAIAAVLDELHRHGCLAREPQDAAAGTSVALLGRFEVPGLPDVGALLAAAGVTLTSRAYDADAVIVLSAGELDRERVDPLIRRRTSHVVVRLVDGSALLGPFVVPGTTACVRCIDAHQTVRDPDHVAVTTRYAHATHRPRGDGVPDLDPALASVALAWAVRDVLAHLHGREPATWSRTLVLGPAPANRHDREWLRHPQCGCCWSADAATSGTMEA
ncbi:MAG: hypothetical protein JWR85_758 [Marmoricola sp.]|nr:hypothetical protein [Marmoricola sp.]